VDQEIWQEQKDREEQALRAVQDAEQRLEQARIRLEEARQNEITGIQQSEARLREAQVILEDVRAGAEPEDIARARADVADAEAQLANLIGARRQAEIAAAQAGIASSQANVAASAADVSSAEASLQQAQAQLEQRRAELEDLTAGPRDPEINDREARVLQAEVNLRDAELDLEKATLYSPIAGTVVEMHLERGERVEASEVGALVADFSEWEIRTTDLTELGIVRVRVGSQATITFDALPDLRLRGEVSRIQEIGKNEQGDIVYEVTIEPLEWDDRLLWGMTATVSIEPIDGAADSD
jgi:HlyD family secretion protein